MTSDDELTPQQVKRSKREASQLRLHGVVAISPPKRSQTMKLKADGWVMIKKPKRNEAAKLLEDGLVYVRRRKTLVDLTEL